MFKSSLLVPSGVLRFMQCIRFTGRRQQQQKNELRRQTFVYVNIWYEKLRNEFRCWMALEERANEVSLSCSKFFNHNPHTLFNFMFYGCLLLTWWSWELRSSKYFRMSELSENLAAIYRLFLSFFFSSCSLAERVFMSNIFVFLYAELHEECKLHKRDNNVAESW